MSPNPPSPPPPLPPYAPSYYYDSKQDLGLYHLLLWLVLFGLALPTLFLLYALYDMNFNWQSECPEAEETSHAKSVAVAYGQAVDDGYTNPGDLALLRRSNENTEQLASVVIPGL
jgi:hypothetical protein